MVSGQQFLLDIPTIGIEYRTFPLKVNICPKRSINYRVFANLDYFKTFNSSFVKTLKLVVSPFVSEFHADKEYMDYVLHFEL